MMMYRPSFLTFTALITLGIATVATGMISEQCKQETEVLQQNKDLGFAFNELLTEFKEDVEHVCDFSSSGVDCGVDYSDQNATFSAICVEAGGQIVGQNLRLNCELLGVEFGVGIGRIPYCVGASCNTTAWDVADVNDTTVDEFLNELSFSGCEATASAGAQAQVGYIATTFGLVGASLLASVGGIL